MKALRSAIEDAASPTPYDASAEPHVLGQVLVSAVFDAFTTIFKRKSERYLRELERIERLVARLRRLAPTAEPSYTRVDLNIPIRHAVEVVEAEAAINATLIASTLASSPVVVFGDSAELEELFLNLLTNALEAVIDQPLQCRSIRISVFVDSGCAVAIVRDSGRGISAEVINRLFDTCVTTKTRGSGLGLAICKGIAERHRAASLRPPKANRPCCHPFPPAGARCSTAKRRSRITAHWTRFSTLR